MQSSVFTFIIAIIVIGNNIHGQGKPDPNLYWGFFDGRAPVQTRGKWADPNYKLCDRSFITAAFFGHDHDSCPKRQSVDSICKFNSFNP